MEPQRFAFTIAEARQWSGLGTTKIYELIGCGLLEARKSGSRTLIPAESLRRYLESLPPAAIRTGQKTIAN